jgi:YHS domain-containing protein
MNRSRLFLQQMVLALVSIFLASTASYAQGNASAQPRVVLKGHDPVAYFSEKKPVKGDPKFSHDWDGARYLFANAENRKKFVADPERYEPQFGGYCTGSMANGVRNEADPEAWIIANGKLYVFGAVKFRDMARNDPRYLTEKVALAGENYRKSK